MMASDPRGLDGGRFQYFVGTTDEAAMLGAKGEPIPEDRVVSVEFPGPGWAIVQQGNRVVHRAARLRSRAERTTFLVSYVATDMGLPDPTRIRDFRSMDPLHIVLPEWARHKAWLARRKLDRLIAELPFTDDRATIIAALEDAKSELEAAIAEVADESSGHMMRYGKLG
jgi:hypothetical protein